MPNKTLWDHIATLGNGVLVVVALVMLAWAACSNGEPSYDRFEPSTHVDLRAEIAA